MDPIEMYERAASDAASLVGQVQPDQRHAPTPCSDWDVEAHLAHMGAGPAYLLGALGEDAGAAPTDEASYRAAVARSAAAAREPGAIERPCTSPAGFEWTVAEAAAGTAMNQLVHTWDLAVAIDADRGLDPEVVAACVAMFVPAMPEIGRQAGFVGPEVPVDDAASDQDRLLAAMGRNPAI
jgi:uncharacterized protein (TIGR03086 family)